jgi:hypothetical protein
MSAHTSVQSGLKVTLGELLKSRDLSQRVRPTLENRVRSGRSAPIRAGYASDRSQAASLTLPPPPFRLASTA